jgi:hypothetical protein
VRVRPGNRDARLCAWAGERARLRAFAREVACTSGLNAQVGQTLMMCVRAGGVSQW